jgi:hypothetical protein
MSATPQSAFAKAGSSAMAPARARGGRLPGSLLDNWLKGRRGGLDFEVRQADGGRAARLEGARVMERLAGHAARPLPQGTPITPAQGILFTTYATLRSDARGEKGFARPADRRMVGDRLSTESLSSTRAMPCRMPVAANQNAAIRPSQQGRAGLRLQHALPRCPHPLCLGDRGNHGPQPRLCPAARPLGR